MWYSVLATFILGITESVVKRVITALGLGLISYGALTTLASSLISHVNSSYSAMGTVPLALLQLAGAPEALSILTSALLGAVTMKALRPNWLHKSF